ncbi:MAG: hypothetical protein FWG46_03330 [Treponema sp.]|jgi:hypothetical protein|nr:hypothetical protein [Treponema sp.]
MTKILSGFERQLCDIQGRLFEHSLIKGLDSADFMEKFMKSKTCEFLDMPYDRLQWSGEEYIMENLLEEISILPAGEVFNKEELFWAGYVYRYWHLFTGESGLKIYAQAKARRMKECYPGFHALDIAMAIEDLKEIHCQESAF